MTQHNNKDSNEIAVTVSVRTFAKLIVMVVATVVLLMAIRQASAALLLIFTAFFLALALNAPVNWVGKHLPGRARGSRVLATSISFFIVVILLGSFLASIVPPLAQQTETFVSAVPRLIQDFQDVDSGIGQVIQRYDLEDQLDKAAGQLNGWFSNIGGSAFSAFQTVTSSIFALLTILVLTFMMLVEGPKILAFFRELVPKKRRELTDRLSRDMYKVVKGFVNGQVALASLAAVAIFPALIFLGISYPVALLVIVFLCGLIPMVGNTIGAIIVGLVALTQSVSAAVFILAYYLIYQQLENIFIQPRIQANLTNMSPLLVFSAVIIGIGFGGIFGGLVAIPVAGCIRIAVLEYLLSQNLIDAPTVEKTAEKATVDTKA